MLIVLHSPSNHEVFFVKLILGELAAFYGP